MWMSPAPGRDSLEERFVRLLAEHGAALGRLATAHERDPRDREDLMQEIAFAIWRALPSFRGESSERTFVFRIGHNRAITHRSRSRTERQRRASADLLEIPDPSADPSAGLIAAERHADLMDAVRALSPVLRETVVLSLEGMSHIEIADVLGTTTQTVAVRLTRARAALAIALRPSDRATMTNSEVHP